jgi:hypothetical protein
MRDQAQHRRHGHSPAGPSGRRPAGPDRPAHRGCHRSTIGNCGRGSHSATPLPRGEQAPPSRQRPGLIDTEAVLAPGGRSGGHRPGSSPIAGITRDAAGRFPQRPGARVLAHPQACRAMRTRAALSGWSHPGATTPSGTAVGRELGGRRPWPSRRAAALSVVLPPAAPSRLATLAAAGVSSRLAGEQVVRGRRRLWLAGAAG